MEFNSGFKGLIGAKYGLVVFSMFCNQFMFVGRLGSSWGI